MITRWLILFDRSVGWLIYWCVHWLIDFYWLIDVIIGLRCRRLDYRDPLQGCGVVWHLPALQGDSRWHDGWVWCLVGVVMWYDICLHCRATAADMTAECGAWWGLWCGMTSACTAGQQPLRWRLSAVLGGGCGVVWHLHTLCYAASCSIPQLYCRYTSHLPHRP